MRIYHDWNATAHSAAGRPRVFTGVQLLTIGVLPKLQARTYHESQGKPIFAVRRCWRDRKGMNRMKRVVGLTD